MLLHYIARVISRLSFLVILVLSCEQVVEIDLPEYQPELVLSCSHDVARSASIKMTLTQSRSIQDNELSGFINEDVIAELYQNDTLLGELINDLSLTDYSLFFEKPLTVGSTCKITVQLEGFEPITAMQIVPSSPDVHLTEFINQSNIQVNGKQQDVYTIELHDEAGIDNYYEFKLYTLNKENLPTKWRDRNIRTRDILLEEGEKTLYLKDDTFDGGSYSFELLSNARDTSKFDIRLRVMSITRDRYLFAKTLRAYLNAKDNPFAEPVIVHTNVNNGQGIFSIENSVDFDVKK